MLQLKKEDLEWAADAGLLSIEQVEPLWRGLIQRRSDDVGVRISPSTGTVTSNPIAAVMGRFDLVHVAWYAGTLLIMGALGWFATLGIDAWGGPGIFGIAGSYGVFFAVVGAKLRRTHDLKVLGGLLVAAAVSMVAPTMYGLQRMLGVWPDADPGSYAGFYDWIKGGWFGLEVATLVVGAMAVRFVPYSFVLLPVGIAAWFMSMDMAGIFFVAPTSQDRALVSAITGVGIIAVAVALRFSRRVHLTYWLEVFGLLAFQGGMLEMRTDTLATKFVFLAIQCGLLTLGVLWQRRAFSIAGVIGVVAVLGWALDRPSHLYGATADTVPVYFELVFMSVGLGAMTVAYGLLAQSRRWQPTATIMLVLGSGAMLIGPFRAFTDNDLEVALAAWAVFAVVVVVGGVFLRSRLVTAVGGLALTAYLLHLADKVFHDSMLFPIVLVSIGLGVIAGGVFLHRRREAIDAFMSARVPAWARGLRGDEVVVE